MGWWVRSRYAPTVRVPKELSPLFRCRSYTAIIENDLEHIIIDNNPKESIFSVTSTSIGSVLRFRSRYVYCKYLAYLVLFGLIVVLGVRSRYLDS